MVEFVDLHLGDRPGICDAQAPDVQHLEAAVLQELLLDLVHPVAVGCGDHHFFGLHGVKPSTTAVVVKQGIPPVASSMRRIKCWS